MELNIRLFSNVNSSWNIHGWKVPDFRVPGWRAHGSCVKDIMIEEFMVKELMVEQFMVGKSRVGKSMVEILQPLSLINCICYISYQKNVKIKCYNFHLTVLILGPTSNLKYFICRQQCLSDSQCEFYVWKGFSSSKTCHLKSSSLWLPTYESGSVSGKK